MKILSADFIKSCEQPDQFPKDRLPAVAFAGRSNVGKSSLINSLLHRKGLARVSRTPGKTQTINVFLVTTDDPLARRFYVVDLPGYGYAKVAKSLRARWRPLIEGYLTGGDSLRGVLLLLDSRGGERAAGLAALRDAFGLAGNAEVVSYSSVTHEGRDELWRVIRTMLIASSG